MDERPRTPPAWSLLGCGCAALVAVAMLSFLVLAVTTWRRGESFEAALGGDPRAAAAQVRSILPHHELPDGYHPLGGLSVPVLFELAMLTDLPPHERSPEPGSPRFRRRGFLYVGSFSLRRGDERLLAAFEGGVGEGETEFAIPADDIGSDLGLGFDSREVVGRGRVPMGAGEALYVARRGELRLGGEGRPGLATFLYLRCPESRRTRLGLWFGPEPPAPSPEAAPEVPAGPLPPHLAGSPADPAALGELLAHFEVCG